MSGPITQSQLLMLSRAAVLLKVADAALSDFETQLVAEVRARWIAFGRQAVVTAAEWVVVETSVEAMSGYHARRFGRAA